MAKRQTAKPPIEDEEVLEITIPTIQEDVPQESVDGFKTTAVSLISVTDEALKAIETTYGKFTIDGDAKRYKEAKTVKNKLVKVRTGIDKRRIGINKEFTAAVNAEAARITMRTTAVENHLVTELTNYEEAEQRRIEERRTHIVTKLTEAGFTFNGVLYECGERMIWQTEIDTVTDELLENHVRYAVDFRLNEATAAAEAARLAAPVYLHQAELNELLQMTRGEYENEKARLDGNGVVEITKEKYDEIREAKLAVFRRAAAPATATAPAAATTPAPPAPVEKNPFPEHDPNFMSWTPEQTAPAIKPNTAFLPEEPQFEATMVVSPASEMDVPGSWEDTKAFNRGYEKFRSQILHLFKDANVKHTREGWIKVIETLMP
jgi:hypothetical protein